MRYREGVRGTQAQMPDEIGMNGSKVYARANIVRIDEEDGEEPGFHGWEYDEAILSSEEYDALKALSPTWKDDEWNAALRTVERRARYERMDPKVMALRRYIELGIDVETNTGKLQAINEYCKAVTETKMQNGYPLEVVYPQEPEEAS